MTENIGKTQNRAGQYRSPLVKAFEVNAQGILCLSDTSLNGWSDGSNSGDIDMEEVE